MPQLTGGWRLEGGFSHLVEGTSLELLLQTGPAGLNLDLSPVDFLRKERGATLTFQADRSIRGYLPKRVSWKIEPDGRIVARLLRSGNAYLGNFRVPEGQFGLQWTVSGRIGTVSQRQVSDVLFNFRSGTRVTFSWVELFQEESSVREAMLASWTGFRDPFDPREIALIRPDQVCQFSWSGSAQVRLSVDWDLTKGWEVGGGLESWFDAAGGLRLNLGIGAEYTWRREGDFSVRWANRQGGLSMSLRRDRGWGSSASIEVGLGAYSRARFKSPNDLLDPALEPLREKIREGLVRRAEILLAAEAFRWRRRKHWIKASWKTPLPSSFVRDCTRILAGELPDAAPGLRITSALEHLRGRRIRLSLNLLNWISVGSEKLREETERLELDPMGNLVLERNIRIERRNWRGDHLRFLRLLVAAGPDAAAEAPIRWLFGTEGDLSREDYLRLVGAARDFGILDQDRRAPLPRFSGGRRLLWGSEFSSDAVAYARESSGPDRWSALVRALELSEPARYGRDTYWRDWIDRPELRDLVDRGPVQAELSSRYPVPGRSEIQRRQTVSEYRRFRHFLRLVERWANKRVPEEKEWDGLEQLMDVPIFYFFHALCPPRTRRSFLLVSGGEEQLWGDQSLLDSMVDDSSVKIGPK